MFFSPTRRKSHHFSSSQKREHSSPVTPISTNPNLSSIPNRPTTGTPAPWSRASSEAQDAGDRKRLVLSGTASQTAQDEESEALLDSLFHDFLLSGRVDDSREKFRNSGAFEKDDETNVFTRFSKSIVDTLAKHWTTTRGAEIVTMAVLSSQLLDKQQTHQKFLQFLALSKCHEELSFKQRHSLQTIMEHGEKLAGIIQLRELQSSLSQKRSNGTAVSYSDSPDEMAGSLWGLIQLVGENYRRNTVLLMDRDNVEVFYSKVSDIEEVFYCLSHQLQYILGEEKPITVQAKRVCELSNACTVLIRAAMQYRNEHDAWYSTPKGLMSWYCLPVVRNGLWCVASFMLQLLKASANGNEKSNLYSHLEQLTDDLLESYSDAITAKIERGEEHRGLLDEYWERRDALLDSLYQHIKCFLDDKYQHAAVGMAESREDDLQTYYSPLLSIARRHEGYPTLWNICCDFNDSALLQNLMHQSVGPKGGFSFFVFEKLYEKGQFAKLLRLGEEFQEKLSIFLRQHKDFLWLHEVFLNHFSSASETLHALALYQKPAASTEKGFEPDLIEWGQSLTDRKRLLNLSKIAAMTGSSYLNKDDEFEMRIKRIDADLKILKLQEKITALIDDDKEKKDTGHGLFADNRGKQNLRQQLLPPEELIKLCLNGSSRELSLRAFEVFAWTSSSFRHSNKALLEECWKHAADQDDWESLYQGSIAQGWSDRQILQYLSETVLFQASEQCYGNSAETYEGGFDEVLPLWQDDVDLPILTNLTSSVEGILTQHKDYPDAGKLMLTAIMLGKTGSESISEEESCTPME